MTTPSWSEEFDEKYGGFEFAPQVDKSGYDTLKSFITRVESRAREEERQRMVEIASTMKEKYPMTVDDRAYNLALTDLIKKIKSDPNSK